MMRADIERGKTQKNTRNTNIRYVELSNTPYTSWLVPLIVVIYIVMFIVTMYVNNCPKNIENNGTKSSSQEVCAAKFLGRFSFEPLKKNPFFGPSAVTLEKMGGLKWKNIVHWNQQWRLVTCLWLHVGIVHLLANMLSLLFSGIRLEQQFGCVRVGIIYLLSGFGGSIISALFVRENIMVGATGALFGLLGAMLAELITNWTIYSNKTQPLITLLVIISINLAMGIFPHVDSSAHFAGFLTGFFLGFIILMRPQIGWEERHHYHVKAKHKAYQYVLMVLAIISLIAMWTFGLMMLFKGKDGNDYCSWCHYLSCLPSLKWSCGGYWEF